MGSLTHKEMLSHKYLSFSINSSIAAKSQKHCEIASVCGLASSVVAI